MTHPTCAHARHPDSPHSGEVYSDSPSTVDLAVLRRRIAVHRAAMTRASDAATCLGDLLNGARRLNDAEFAVGVPALRTLIDMIGDDFHRHMKEALDAAMRMQALEG